MTTHLSRYRAWYSLERSAASNCSLSGRVLSSARFLHEILYHISTAVEPFGPHTVPCADVLSHYVPHDAGLYRRVNVRQETRHRTINLL
jgi:hypothetical protein